MRVDIWSDIVCPWCYIGKRRFDQALASFGGRDEVEVVHHSFELDPSFDRDRPQLLLDMLAAKYRLDPEQAGRAEARVAAQAAADGLGYTSDRLVGNTFDGWDFVAYVVGIVVAIAWERRPLAEPGAGLFPA